MKLAARFVLALSMLSALLAVTNIGRRSETRAAQKQVRRKSPVPTKEYGIDKRVPWTTSRITGSLEPPSPYRLQRVFPKLQFDKLISFVTAPGIKRLFAVELEGKVFSFPNDAAVETADLFIDLQKQIDGASNIYGIAFHPDFVRSRYVYLCYILKAGGPQGTRVSRFEVRDSDPPVVDAASETIIIEWPSGGHNGCCLKFGPRRLLVYQHGRRSRSQSTGRQKYRAG